MFNHQHRDPCSVVLLPFFGAPKNRTFGEGEKGPPHTSVCFTTGQGERWRKLLEATDRGWGVLRGVSWKLLLVVAMEGLFGSNLPFKTQDS